LNMHYCAISDEKIKSFGATQTNCVRGFQGYVHLCDATAMLDFDEETSSWCLNEQHQESLIKQLQNGRAKVDENLRLLHDDSCAAILILIECQPLYTRIRRDEVATNTLIEFDDEDSSTIIKALQFNRSNLKQWPIKILGVPSWPNANYAQTFKYGMEWLVAHSPKYPKIYKAKSDIVREVFEKIFDHKLLGDAAKIDLWNSEMDNIVKNVVNGMNGRVSWPPCSIDDKHQLVVNHVVPPSHWNTESAQKKFLASLQKLKIDAENQSHPKKHIIQSLSALDDHWWTTNPIKSTREFICDLSSYSNSDASNYHCAVSDNASVSSRSTVQLMEFEQLLADISGDFDKTLAELQSFTHVVESMQDRMNELK